ncbi:hypothetical protein FOA43_004269 [Brettanomyces nanus]|uniref:C2 domain-containing protein n=1 Tax=Eeniella nana TaxID=13502 RepID=A0A875S9S4_EENNA|nr:uncharacterized protein FOA43_004269 [Brettanomyces nanus]QPG76875.1 hypothetical protein FOA43_004269 [Brettanomyces nanus]
MSENTELEDRFLDYYLRIQLIYDDSFKLINVVDIPEIPKQPYISTKKIHIRLGSRSEVFKKEFVTSISDLSKFTAFPLDPSFRNTVTRFYSYYNDKSPSISHWDISSTLNKFEEFVGSSISTRCQSFYIQNVQLIDLMLSCRSTDHQKEVLLKRRQSILSKSFEQIPMLTDPEIVTTISCTFNIDEMELRKRIVQLKLDVSKQDVVLILKSRQSLSNQYSKDDFETKDQWQFWIDKINEQNNKLVKLFSTPDTPHLNLLPVDLDLAVHWLVQLAFKGNPKFFETVIKCLQVWQIDPCKIFFEFLSVAPPRPKSVVKAVSLAYLASPAQVTWINWPLQMKRKALAEGMDIYKACEDEIGSILLHFFDDRSSFSTALLLIKQLHLSSSKMPPRLLVSTNVRKCFGQRLQTHLEALHLDLENNSGTKLDINLVNALLTKIVSDTNILHNWKVKNQDIDRTFAVYETAQKIIVSPAMTYVRQFIVETKKRRPGVVSSWVSKENRPSFSTMLEMLGSLKSLTSIKFDFQDILFEDFQQLVSSWEKEMLDKTKLAVENDDQLIRLNGCSYSSSVQNIMGVCNAYVKLLESFQWENTLHLAYLYCLLYRGICSSLLYYSSSMSSRLTKDLHRSTGTLNFRGESCTCLNNLTKILQYFKEFENERLFECSAVLEAYHDESLENPRKLVSIRILNAENVEDSKGEPVCLSVKIDGLISGRTRCIWKDYNPSWDEEFESMIGKTESLRRGGHFRIELYDENTSSIYKAISYSFDLNSVSRSVLPIDEKISLQPRAGALNISISVEAEKNDPLFYLSRAQSQIGKSKDRAIKLFVDKFSRIVREIFSHEHLDESLKLAPVKKDSHDYCALKDGKVDSYINQMQLHTIPELYDNLETQVFDQVTLRLWSKILESAENLLLPRVSFIFHNIVARLDKRSSIVNGGGPSFGFGSSSRFHKTTKNEMTRVVQWCWKFRKMLNIPEKVLQNPLVGPFDEFIQIPQLYEKNAKELEDGYYQIWSFLSKKLPKKYSRGKYDKKSVEKASQDKELMMRVLLARGETKFVRRVMEIEERYERAVKTEIEIDLVRAASPHEMDISAMVEADNKQPNSGISIMLQEPLIEMGIDNDVESSEKDQSVDNDIVKDNDKAGPLKHQSSLESVSLSSRSASLSSSASAAVASPSSPIVPRLPDDTTQSITSVAPPKMPSMTFPVPNIDTSAPSESNMSAVSALSTSALSNYSAKSTSNSSTASSMPVNTVAYSLPADPATTKAEASGSDISRANLETLNESLDTIDQLLGSKHAVSRIHNRQTSMESSSSMNSGEHRTPNRSSSNSSGSAPAINTVANTSPRPQSYFMSSIRSFANSMTGSTSSPTRTGSNASIDSNRIASLQKLGAESVIEEEEESTKHAENVENVKNNENDENEVAKHPPFSSGFDDYDPALYTAEKYLDTQYRYACDKRNAGFHRLFPSLPEEDRLLDDFSCALSREILLQGRLYVSDHYLCFSSNLLGWVTSVVISFDEILGFDRRTTAGLFPNGIIVETMDSKHSFASLISRDSTMNFLATVWSKSVALSRRKNEKARDMDLVESSLSVHSNGSKSMLSESDILTIDEDDSNDDDSESSNEGENKALTASSNNTSLTTIESEKYHIRGPLTHAPTEHEIDYKKNGETQVLDFDFDAPLGFIFKALFGPNNALHKKVMEMSDGFEFSDYGTFDKETDGEKPVRKFEYQKGLNYSIGPKSTTVEVAEYLEYEDFEDYVEVLSISRTPGVPSGGAFDVRTRYLFTWGPLNRTNLKCSFWVNWTGSSWIKGMIEHSTVAGQEKSISDLKHLLLDSIPESRDVYTEETLEEAKREKRTAADSAKILEREAKRARKKLVPTPATITTGFMVNTSPLVVGGISIIVLLQLIVLVYLYNTSGALRQIMETQNIILKQLYKQSIE